MFHCGTELTPFLNHEGKPRGNQDYGSFFLRTMRYSLRRALSLDSLDGCTPSKIPLLHLDCVFGSSGAYGSDRDLYPSLRRARVSIRARCFLATMDIIFLTWHLHHRPSPASQSQVRRIP